jgi:uncharacterized protein YPO0396
MAAELGTPTCRRARITSGDRPDSQAVRRSETVEPGSDRLRRRCPSCPTRRSAGLGAHPRHRGGPAPAGEPPGPRRPQDRAVPQRPPAETQEIDPADESAAEFRALHDRLAHDDLPRFEATFKDYLNTSAVRDIAGFNGELHGKEAQISERIATINASLRGIDYNDGRYITLDTARTPNQDVRAFIADLRACTEGALGADDSEQYSEEKFIQVKRLIERFRGREGTTDLDRAWTRRVTDVRNWFTFSASERWRADDAEHEVYTDSGGKSGGQKEKLAYTILAASLAYQFRLDSDRRARTFRFVVIDEAFGRGSDESTRYALRLFDQMGLQLLIVTPLQKIHVIEPFVSAVGFVSNPTGNSSQLQTLTIEEYRERKALHAALQVTVDDDPAASVSGEGVA